MSNRRIKTDVLSEAQFCRILESDEQKIERIKAWHRKHGDVRVEFVGYLNAFGGMEGTPTPGGIENSEANTATAISASGATSYTFNSVSIGTDQGGSTLVIGVHPGSVSAPSISLTVNASAATLIQNVAGGSRNSALFYFPSISGTTANIVVTVGASANSCGIALWRVYGVYSSVPVTSNVGSQGAAAGTITANLTTKIQYVIIGYCGYSSTTNRTATWVGLTPDFDQIVAGGATTHNGASAVETSDQTRTISNTPSGTLGSGGSQLITAAWF